MRSALLVLFAASLAAAAELPGRVIVLSLDGMSWQALQADPATQPLAALRALLKTGAHAAGVTPHFPSTTSNSHAALWTGAWGDVNGITSNTMPVAPRAEHTAFERTSGFNATGLRAEPVWLAAARQGVSAVTLQTTQSYPFVPATVGADAAAPLTVLNGYQTKLIAPDLFLQRRDVKAEPCPAAAARSPRKPVCFTWMAGPVALHAALTGDRISVSAGGASVDAVAAPLEGEPPLRRELARHVSPGLYLPGVPAVVYFRLFAASAGGSDFFLYESAIRELAVYRQGKVSPEAAEQILREAGGFLTNGPNHSLTDEPFNLGAPLWKGGDGTAERRYLEIAELLARQEIRYAQWLWRNYDPRLFVSYFPLPDEFEHSWKGLAARDSRFVPLRAWGYTIVNRAVEAWTALRATNDDFVFVSDHGMAPASRQIRINAALKDAGLLAVDAEGKIDPARTQVIHLTNCLLVNTGDWKGGIVPLADRARVIARAGAALRAIRDPATGDGVIAGIYDSPHDAARFGFGGPNGADLCFDYLPGYGTVDGAEDPVVSAADPPRGTHGMMPGRPDMQAILIAAGPGLPPGKAWSGVHSIDIAPLLAHLLGIHPPRDARGKSPV